MRWLRRDYQRTRFDGQGDVVDDAPMLDLPAAASRVTGAHVESAPTSWPADAIGQITALRAIAVMTLVSIEEAVQRFSGAKRELVGRHLETLAMLGEVREFGDGRYALATGAL